MTTPRHRPGPWPRCRPRGRLGAEEGSSTLELTVVFPVVLLILFGVIQGALYFHGRNVAQAAAEQGVRAARAAGQSDRAATASGQARQFLADTGEFGNLTHLVITPVVDTNQVRVTVTAQTISLLPGLGGPSISATASGAIEHFTNGSDR